MGFIFKQSYIKNCDITNSVYKEVCEYHKERTRPQLKNLIQKTGGTENQTVNKTSDPWFTRHLQISHNPLYNTVHSYMVFGYNTLQRWIPKMYRLYRKNDLNGHFFYIIFTFWFGYNTPVDLTGFLLWNPTTVFIKRLWCIFLHL